MHWVWKRQRFDVLRHCGQRVRPKAGPMINSAKQSRASKKKLDWFGAARLAMTMLLLRLSPPSPQPVDRLTQLAEQAVDILA